jgi:Zn ribbon nucleic-acid-binding protein
VAEGVSLYWLRNRFGLPSMQRTKGDKVMPNEILFECPTCEARHTRGFLDGVCLFRCLHCGYQGHGFHPDPDIDRAVFADHQESNRHSRALGIPETPLGVDPLNYVS